uniref:SH3 domain-containing protein n=1 Tax=Clostridium perfringens TaxID=1502 RepID=UPI0039E9B0A7
IAPKISSIDMASRAIRDLRTSQNNYNIIEQAISEVKNIVKLGIASEISNIDTIISKEEYIENSLELKETNEILNDSELNIEQKLYSIIEKFKSKHPMIVIFLTIFIFSSVQSYIEDIGKDIIKGCIEQFKSDESNINIDRKVKKTVVKEMEDENKEQILKTYRFVDTDVLFVRSNKSIKSKKIGELRYGSLIKVLNKNRNWTLVEYSENDCYIKGWVFTRYISRFDR